MFRKRFRDAEQYAAEVAPLIECLVAARGPLDEAHLREASGLDRCCFATGLRQLSQFLRRSRGACELFHKSLSDWLGDAEASDRFFAPAEEGHVSLARSCADQYAAGVSATSPYALRHLLAHSLAAERWDDVETLACDLHYVEARCAAGQVYELQREYDALMEAFPGREQEVRADRAGRERVREYAVQLARDPNGASAPPSMLLKSDSEIAQEVDRVAAAPHPIGYRISREIALICVSASSGRVLPAAASESSS
jgi:hypothetical protein